MLKYEAFLRCDVLRQSVLKFIIYIWLLQVFSAPRVGLEPIRSILQYPIKTIVYDYQYQDFVPKLCLKFQKN